MSLERIVMMILSQARKEGILALLLVICLGVLIVGGYFVMVDLRDLNTFQREILLDEMIRNRDTLTDNIEVMREVKDALQEMEQ